MKLGPDHVKLIILFAFLMDSLACCTLFHNLWSSTQITLLMIKLFYSLWAVGMDNITCVNMATGRTVSLIMSC